MAVVFEKPKALTDAVFHYCPGCTHGIIHRLVAEAIDTLGIEGRTIGIAPVGSPIVNTPNVLMVMNNPSLDKYENAVQPGGKIFLDSTLIARKVTRTDVEAYYVPATKMAMDMGMPTLANMILLGALISKTGCVREESLADALHKVIPARKADLFDLNMQALQAGKEFAG